ncbi:MAG: ABC transporter permease subunit [Planctomycetota bacterium]|nr:ABC transporter permease subunit [Planctomycetota bacterium]
MAPKVRAVYAKELRDCLRDRRTLFASVVVPLLLYPVMMLGMFEVVQIARTRLQHEVYEVAIPPGTSAFFEKLSKLPEDAGEKGETVPGKRETDQKLKAPAPSLAFKEMEAQDAEKALEAGNVRAVVMVPPDIEQRVAAQADVKVDMQFDRAEQRSRDAESRLEVLFGRYRNQVVRSHLEAQKLKREFLHPFTLVMRNVAHPSKLGGSMLGLFLPFLFIMMIITGAIYPAIDMTAGEKERSTLETLVSMPVRPIEVIAGKFLAVATMALGNATLNVASFAATFFLLPAPQMAQFQFPWAALPLTLLLLLPLALFFAGMLLAVSSFASNQKEAQVYCLPVYLVPLLGMMVVMTPGIELEGPLVLVPVVNAALLIKELFLYHGTTQQIVFVFVSTCFYAAGTVALAARVFAREEVLFSAQNSLRLFLSRRFFRPSAEPKAGDGLLVLALVFPLNFYLQLWLTKVLLDPVAGLTPAQFAMLVLLPEYLLFMALPLAVAWYLKLDWRKTFLWRMPRFGGLLGGLCLGCSSWLIAMQLVSWQSYVWKYTPGDMGVLEKAVAPLFQSAPGITLLIFLMGITPGVCEEHLFRGFLQQGLRRSGKWTTVLAVGLIFGAYHFPLFRQPITALMGVALAYAAWETRSIWPSVLFHACHNSLATVGPTMLGLRDAPPEAGQPLPGVALKYLLPAVALFAAGLWLVRQARAEDAPPSAATS